MLGLLRGYGWFVGAGIGALILVVLGQGLIDVLRDRRKALEGNGLSAGSPAGTRAGGPAAEQQRHVDRSTES